MKVNGRMAKKIEELHIIQMGIFPYFHIRKIIYIEVATTLHKEENMMENSMITKCRVEE